MTPDGGSSRPALIGRPAAVVLLAAALALRIGLLAAGHASEDSRYHQLVVTAGHPALYAPASRFYHWSPLWAQCLFGMDAAARALKIPFFLALGFTYIVVDSLTAWVLARSGGIAAALLFFLNPVSILTSTVYQQFDAVALLFLVLALAASPPAARARHRLAAAYLSLSLLVKQIAWFHPLLFVRRRSGERHSFNILPLAAYGVFALSFLPFWRFWPGIREQVLNYHSGPQEYGLARLGLTFSLQWVIFVAAMLVTIWAVRRIDLPRASAMLFLVVLVTIPGSWDYYYVWPVAVGAFSGGAGYAVYSAVVSLYMIGSPDGLDLQMRWTHLPDASGPWWAAIFWLLWEIRRGRSWAASRDRFSLLLPSLLSRPYDILKEISEWFPTPGRALENGVFQADAGLKNKRPGSPVTARAGASVTGSFQVLRSISRLCRWRFVRRIPS